MELTTRETLSTRARHALWGVWAFRARAETEAILRFTRLTRELRDQGAERVVVELAERAIDDETRHAKLCLELAATYGSRPLLTPTDACPIGPRQMRARDRVLYEVVAFACVTETLNASLMQAAHAEASIPHVRQAVHSILRDEVRHSRLGWAHLSAERALGHGQFVAALLPRMLAGAVREELFSPLPIPEADEAELVPHAELPARTRLAVFEAAARDVLLPGFEALGLDTRPARAWIARALGRPLVRPD